MKPNAAFASRVQRELAQHLSGATLASEVQSLRKRADALATKAEESGDSRTALMAIRELTRLLELQGRMMLEAREARASDVSSHPVWMTVSGLIMLAICPECRPKVLSVIRDRLGIQGT